MGVVFTANVTYRGTQIGKVTADPGSYSTSAPGTTTVYHPLMSAAKGATVYQIFMVNNAGTKVIAAPSVPDSDSDGFAAQLRFAEPGITIGCATPALGESRPPERTHRLNKNYLLFKSAQNTSRNNSSTDRAPILASISRRSDSVRGR